MQTMRMVISQARNIGVAYRSSTDSSSPKSSCLSVGSQNSSQCVVGEMGVVDHQFNANEMSLLRRSWSDDFDVLYELGLAFFSYIFKAAPGSTALFPGLTDQGNNQWSETGKFRCVSVKVVQSIAYMIKNVQNNRQATDNHLKELGRMHARMAEETFQPNYWVLAKEGLVNLMAERLKQGKCVPHVQPEENEDALKVWNRLSIYMVEMMQCGFEQERAESKAANEAKNGKK